MLLADHFLLRTNQKFGKSVEFDDETREYLLKYHWPGNVRELENAVSRYVVLGKLGSGFELTGAPRIDPIDPVKRPISGLNQDVDPVPEQNEESEISQKHPHEGMPLKEIARIASREAERKAILSVLEATRWNRSRAALILKISYKALLYKIKDCGIVRA